MTRNIGQRVKEYFKGPWMRMDAQRPLTSHFAHQTVMFVPGLGHE